MIKKLQKKISVLLTALFGIVLIGVLVLYNWGNYQDNMREMRMGVRQEITDAGWLDFIQSKGEAVELDIAYSIFKVNKDGSVELWANHYPQMEVQRQYEYVSQIVTDWKIYKQFFRVTYLSKNKTRIGKYVVLISGQPALKESMAMILASALLAAFGIAGLLLVTRMLSRHLVQPVDQMIHAEKKFMSNTSHELKTPLTVISANTQLLAKEIGDNRHLQYIQQETERMISMVNKMLTLMRLDAPYEQTNFQKFYVDEALFDVIYPMESIAYEKHLKMDYTIEDRMLLSGDVDQIKNLMSILLDNAISYTPENGSIHICAGLKARKFILRVSNSGDPIPKNQQDMLFERFFRIDEARGDSDDGHFGLGLSIAGSIVANHHGKISVESHDGQNIFHVVLPNGK